MILRIISPNQSSEHAIEWIEVESYYGKKTIQNGHAPSLCTLRPKSTVQFFAEGTLHTKEIEQGFMKNDRTSVTLLLDAS